jgi:flagellar protein FlbT
MSALILELKQGESMILNGAVIRFKTRTRIELNSQARFLFGKQIMPEEQAVSRAQKLYYALQQAYIGDETARPAALLRAHALIVECQRDSDPSQAELFERLQRGLAGGAGFETLKLARQLIREEEAAES